MYQTSSKDTKNSMNYVFSFIILMLITKIKFL